MSQLMSGLLGRFRRNQGQPTATVDWAAIIWAYVASFWKHGWSSAANSRARKECDDRGLAYGSVRIIRGDKHDVGLCPLGEQKLTPAQVKEAISQAVSALGLTDEVLVRDGSADEVEVVIAKETSTLTGWNTCSSRGSYRTFARANCWGGNGLYEMHAASEQALRMLLHALALLGFPAGQKHYTHESPVKIEDIIVYAVRWEDPQTKCRYLDVLWRPELVKHQLWEGSNRWHERTEGSLRGEVLVCRPGGDRWPKAVINSRPVYSTIVTNPTPPMLRAKEKFVEESARACDHCGKLATREFMHAHFKLSDFVGTSSMGHVSYACDDPACAEKSRGQQSLETEERPYTQEVWA